MPVAGTQLPTAPMPWAPEAACRGTDIPFHAPNYEGSGKTMKFDYEQARALCKMCSVRRECLEYALVNNEIIGMWGGLTPNERKTVLWNRRHPNAPRTKAKGLGCDMVEEASTAPNHSIRGLARIQGEQDDQA